MHIYIHVCIYIYIYTQNNIYLYIYIYTHIHTYVYVYTCPHTYIHVIIQATPMAIGDLVMAKTSASKYVRVPYTYWYALLSEPVEHRIPITVKLLFILIFLLLLLLAPTRSGAMHTLLRTVRSHIMI